MGLSHFERKIVVECISGVLENGHHKASVHVTYGTAMHIAVALQKQNFKVQVNWSPDNFSFVAPMAFLINVFEN